MRIVKNRITTSWKLSGTTTFRLASSKLLGFYGINAQNPSSSLMECIIPEDNHIFVQPDQSGAEALIVAYEAPKGRFRSLFENNIKPHTYMALQIFTEKFRGPYPADRYKMVDPSILAAYPEWKELNKTIKDSAKEYDLGKLTIHAKNYDMRWKTFVTNVLEHSEGEIVLSAKDGKEFLGTHEVTFPEILELQAEIRGILSATRVLRNLFGYPRYFGKNYNDALLREAYAFVPQSTVGTITNLAYVDMWRYIKSNRLPWTLLNNKHDSLLTEVPDTAEHKEHVRVKLKEFMERELKSTKGEEYRMKSGISWGYNWGKFDKDTNPHGMKEE